MRTQRFGIEIEMTGITRHQAANVIAGLFVRNASYVGGSYDTYLAKDSQGRSWKVMRDSSIRCESKHGRASGYYSVEVVSPICRYEDIETIQEIVRRLRKNGGMVNSSCGIHVHVDASPHTPKTLRNIVNIMAAKEELLYKALQINVERERFCKKTDITFLERMDQHRPRSMDEIECLWYNGRGGRDRHYDQSRYHALNLHSVFSKGTIEFRLFNSTLHALSLIHI